MIRNPYQPPGDYRKDFRAAAVRESERLIEEIGGWIPEDRSLCIPVAGANPRVLKRYGYWIVLRFVLGVGGLPAGAACEFLGKALANDQQYKTWLAALGLCLTVAGILLLFGNASFVSRFIRRQLGRRYRGLAEASEQFKPNCVNIENADSFSRLKVTPEDWGYMLISPSLHMVVIEGILFRYLIHAKDVLGVEQAAAGGSVGTVVTFSVGSEILRITLSRDMPWGHAARLKRLQETLMSDTPQKDAL